MTQRRVFVDRDDNVLGYKPKAEFGPEDIERVSGLWVTNSKGEVLIAQRALTKKYGPGYWGPAAAGTVEEGETYETNIIKEAEEELGLKGIRPVIGPKFYRETAHKYFCQWFTCVVDLPVEAFKLQPEEVAAVKWIAKEDLRKTMAAGDEKFLSSLAQVIDIF
jgi:isopentenyl-diphosphate Delta-isomerase